MISQITTRSISFDYGYQDAGRGRAPHRQAKTPPACLVGAPLRQSRGFLRTPGIGAVDLFKGYSPKDSPYPGRNRYFVVPLERYCLSATALLCRSSRAE